MTTKGELRSTKDKYRQVLVLLISLLYNWYKNALFPTFWCKTHAAAGCYRLHVNSHRLAACNLWSSSSNGNKSRWRIRACFVVTFSTWQNITDVNSNIKRRQKSKLPLYLLPYRLSIFFFLSFYFTFKCYWIKQFIFYKKMHTKVKLLACIMFLFH